MTIKKGQVKRPMVQRAVEGAVTTVSQAYSEDAGVRVIAKLIPVIGGALDFLLTEPGRIAREARAADFLEGLAEDIGRLGQGKIDRDFLETPEFGGVVERVLRAAVSTSGDEKVKLLRAALLGAVTTGMTSDPLRESMIEAVTILSPAHVKLIAAVEQFAVDPSAAPHEQGIRESQFWTLSKRNEHEDAPLISDLIGRGFVELYSPISGALRRPRDRTYRLTGLGARFLELLRSGGFQEEDIGSIEGVPSSTEGDVT